MENIEFRTGPDGNVYYRVGDNAEHKLSRFANTIIDPLYEMIQTRFPAAFSRLATLYGAKTSRKSELSKIRFQMVERFIRCNFGEHDLLTPDVEHDLLNFEEVHCPLRGGYCPNENVICHPKGLVNLSKAEKEVVHFYLTGYTFDEIAEELDKQPSTVKAQLRSIKTKLNVKNCREIIKVLRMRNL